MIEELQIRDKVFEPYILSSDLEARVRILALEINEFYEDVESDKPVDIIVMMNGAFLFAADLVRLLNFPLHMHFLKSSSYSGMESTGKVKFDLPESLELEDRKVLIIEDIVDTGKTFQVLLDTVIQDRPSDLKICSLLVKNKNREIMKRVDFTGFQVDDPFVVGYGMDYDGQGRDLNNIYILKESSS